MKRGRTPMPKPNEKFTFADEPEPPTKAVINHPQMLLDWLIRFWTGPSITLRDIHRSGPHCLRNKETILNLAQAWKQPASSPKKLGGETNENGRSLGAFH